MSDCLSDRLFPNKKVLIANRLPHPNGHQPSVSKNMMIYLIDLIFIF
jgi:hypothetical protein